ncbi:MAG: hypothetical protein Q8O19_02740 [Rectinemataceae bacterium]|nr:hypothetical protein [Rectinemataceae bacterium]
MTASTPNAITDPGSLLGLQSSITTPPTPPMRSDRYPTLNVHVPADLDTAHPSRKQWVKTLESIDPAVAQRVAMCGSHGNLRMELTPQGRRLVGGKCKEHLCAECGAQIADRDSRLLSDAVLYLTAEEGIAPDRFVFGAITMSHQHIQDTPERVQMLNDAMTEWTQQAWFPRFVVGWEFALDVSGTLRHHRGVLHAHWHVLLVLRPGIDLEHLKQKTHNWFQKRLGRENVNWKTDQDQWNSWLSPAHLTPASLNGKPGFAWKGASEVGACHMKAGKRGEGYSSLYTRSKEDLALLVPLMQQNPPVVRGGIVASVHTHLELRDEIHEAATVIDTKAMPDDLWAKADALTRLILQHVVSSAEYDDAQVMNLLHRVRTMPLLEWESMVLACAAEGAKSR